MDHAPRRGWDKEKFTHERFARDQSFKLYGNGRLFDVSTGVLSKAPLLPAREVRMLKPPGKKLRKVLDKM